MKKKLQKVTLQFNNKKVLVPNSIPVSILKEDANILSCPLSHINSSFKDDYIPNVLKLSK